MDAVNASNGSDQRDTQIENRNFQPLNESGAN